MHAPADLHPAELPPDAEFPPDEPFPQDAGPAVPAWLGNLGAALLSPRTIRALLATGGGLTVAGGLVWLVSLGVFEDPRVLAASLIGGCCAVLAAGWVLATRTRHRTAGLAAAGLACAALPLNLWLLHAQGLSTVGGGLWAWAAGCAGLQTATVYLLRDRRFLLAVQGGAAATALLLLGQFGRLDEPILVAATLAGLGLAAVAAVRLFPLAVGSEEAGGEEKDDVQFDRDDFAAPLLWGGGGLLALAGVAAGAAEAARHAGPLAWLFPPEPEGWAASRLVAAGVWVAIANGFVTLDRLYHVSRGRRDARAGRTRDDGLLGWAAAVPALAAAAGSAAVWNVSEHLGVPDRWDAAVFAACGVGLLALARRAGVGVVRADRGFGEAEEARGPGAAALRAGTAVLLGAGALAVWRGGAALLAGPAWADAAGVAAAALLGWAGAGLHPVAWCRSAHRALAAVAAGLAGLAANQLLDVPLPRKLEAAALLAGAGLLTAAHRGRVREAGGGKRGQTEAAARRGARGRHRRPLVRRRVRRGPRGAGGGRRPADGGALGGGRVDVGRVFGRPAGPRPVRPHARPGRRGRGGAVRDGGGDCRVAGPPGGGDAGRGPDDRRGRAVRRGAVAERPPRPPGRPAGPLAAAGGRLRGAGLAVRGVDFPEDNAPIS